MRSRSTGAHIATAPLHTPMHVCARARMRRHVCPFRRHPLAGNSVCVFVHGFEPYFYVECPPNWVPEHYEELLKALRVGRGLF